MWRTRLYAKVQRQSRDHCVAVFILLACPVWLPDAVQIELVDTVIFLSEASLEKKSSPTLPT